MKAFVLTALSLVVAAAAAPALPQRPRSGRLLDETGVLSPAGRARLEKLSDDLEERTGAQLAVAVVGSLQGLDAADYSHRLFRAWGVGRRGKDDGVLLLLCPSERTSRIEVGYGLEPVLPDVAAGRLLKDAARPYFRAGRFEEGLLAASRGIDDAVTRGGTGAPPEAGPVLSESDFPTWLAVPFCSVFVGIGGFLCGAALGAFTIASFLLLPLGAFFSGLTLFLASLALPLAWRWLLLPWAVLFAAGARAAWRNPDWLRSRLGHGGAGSGRATGEREAAPAAADGTEDRFGGGTSGGGGASDTW